MAGKVGTMLFERVKYLSEKQGKNVKVVALELGLSENYFYSWKTSSPKTEILQKVADYFDVSLDYLTGRTLNPNPLEKADENTPPEYFAIQRKSKKLSQKDQAKLLKIMEATFDDIDSGNFEEDEEDDL